MRDSVRINRDAFRRGVNDVMTFAPLRAVFRELVHKPSTSETRGSKMPASSSNASEKNDGQSPRR